MEEFLSQLMGKKIDVSCGGNAVVRGDVVAVKEGVLHVRDEEERIVYVAVNRIAMVWEVKEHQTRPGFVLKK